jgi:hypothetical protein
MEEQPTGGQYNRGGTADSGSQEGISARRGTNRKPRPRSIRFHAVPSEASHLCARWGVHQDEVAVRWLGGLSDLSDLRRLTLDLQHAKPRNTTCLA